MPQGRYSARIIEVPDHGIRLEPTEESSLPDRPSDVNLLVLAIALALGSEGYQHHPEPRDPELQTLDALLAGDAVMPWRLEPPVGETDAADPSETPVIVCERSATGVAKCHVQRLPA